MISLPDLWLRFDSFQALDLKSAYLHITRLFRAADFDTPQLDARLLIMAATGIDHAALIAKETNPLPSQDIDILKKYIQRRLSGEPIDYILGYREFYGRKFIVNQQVLSPRPETELLIDLAVPILKSKKKPNVLDMGTGSGAIILTLLSECPHIQAHATDISRDAIKTARENAALLELTNRVAFTQSHWFNQVTDKYDLIISNPPYIDSKAMAVLQKEVACFDPILALSGGDDGLEAYRIIAAQAAAYLTPKGHIALEIGYDQKDSVTTLLTTNGFRDITCHKDLSNHDRVIWATMPIKKIL